MAGACTFGRDKMAVQIQVGSPDRGSNAHECTLEGCKRPFSFLSIENAWREYIVQEDCFVHSFPKQYYNGFEESSSSEEHQEASQESDSDPLKAFNIMGKSIYAEKVHLSAEKTQKKGANQEIDGKWEEKNMRLKVQQREHLHLANQVAAEKWKAESVMQEESDNLEWEESGKVHVVQEDGTSTRARAVVGCRGRAKPSNAGNSDNDDNDEEGRKYEKLHQQMPCTSLDKEGNQPRGGPAGKARYHKHITAQLSEELSPMRKPLPHIRQNHQAVMGMCHDDWDQAHCNVALTMPSGICGRGAATTQGDGNSKGYGDKKAGQSKQNDGEKSQTSTRARAVGSRSSRAKPSNAGNGDDDDDDDEGRKPRPSDPIKKKLECDQPTRKKSCSSLEEMDRESQGSRPGRGPEGEEVSESRPLKISPESQSEQELQQQMQGRSLDTEGKLSRGGPAGDARHRKHITVSQSEEPLLVGELLPHTWQNRQALERMCCDDDDDVPAQHDVFTEQGDPPIAMNLAVSPLRAEVQTSVEAEVGGVIEIPPEVSHGEPRDVINIAGPPLGHFPSVPSDISPPRAEVQTSVEAVVAEVGGVIEISPKVSHGEPRDVINFTDYIEHLRASNPAMLRGLHSGVLLDEDLKPRDGQYREGEEYINICRLGEGAFGVAYLLQDKTSLKRFVGKRVSFKNFAPLEPKLWCGLDHRGIMRFFGLLCTDNMMLLSNYKPGSQTLQELIDQSVLGLERVLRIVQRLLVVVFWLHSTHQIVHMDIRAENVVVGEGDWPQLIDFGLSRMLSAPEPPNEASEIDESQLYGMDVQGVGCTLAYMITGRSSCSNLLQIKRLIIGLSSGNVPLRVFRFIEQMVNQKLTAAQALDIAEELCRTVEHDEPEPLLMDAQIGDIPMDALPGPLAPPRGPLDTPCGPQDDSYLGPQGQDQPPANHLANEMSLSDLLISSDVEASQDEQV